MNSMTEPPFAGSFFNTFDDLFVALQRHAREEGWAIVKTRASTRRADGKYYRFDLACHRGVKGRESVATGRREASSRKEGCPWVARAVARKCNGNGWKYETINSTHNHPPSLDASVHPMHRRLTNEERGALERHTQAGSRLNVIASDLGTKNQALKKKDILNERAKLQRQAAGPYTQTQRFVQALQESREFYRLCRGADERIIGVFWTFPWCREMTKTYPDVISMDNTYNVCLSAPSLTFWLTASLHQQVPNAAIRSHRNDAPQNGLPYCIRPCQFRVSRSVHVARPPTPRPILGNRPSVDRRRASNSRHYN